MRPYLTVLLLALIALNPAPAVAQSPVVFELFTSKACTYGAEADAAFQAYEQQGDVIALACYVGDFFSDIYANDACRDRHSAYVSKLDLGSIRTPLVILNGVYDMLGRTKTIKSGMRLAQSTGQITMFDIIKDGARARFSLPDLQPETYDITVYKHKNISQKEPNIVFNISNLGQYSGVSSSYGFDLDGGDFSYAVLVQNAYTSEIVAAGRFEQ